MFCSVVSVCFWVLSLIVVFYFTRKHYIHKTARYAGLYVARQKYKDNLAKRLLDFDFDE